jgi:DNA-binding CsgD family transcriptional regulator
MQRVFDPARAETQAATLTAVEREVAGLIADGLSNQAIARRLGLARVTVSQHVATILWRLGLRARHEIVAWAIDRARPDIPAGVGPGRGGDPPRPAASTGSARMCRPG